MTEKEVRNKAKKKKKATSQNLRKATNWAPGPQFWDII